MGSQLQQLVTKVLRDIVEGRANGRQHSLPSEAVAAQRRAQELLPVLTGGQLRPGVLSEAQSTAEEFLRCVGLLRSDEQLTDDLIVRVRRSDGREDQVSAQRLKQVRDLRERIRIQTGSNGGLIMGGRPMQEAEQLYDLWLRDGLGTMTAIVQVTVQNVGG